MNKQNVIELNTNSFQLALQLFTAYDCFASTISKNFTVLGLRKAFDLTPHMNRSFTLNYFLNNKNYTFVFFPFRVYSSDLSDKEFIGYSSYDVYAFSDSDNVEIDYFTERLANVHHQVSSVPFIFFNKKSLPLSFYNFYENVSSDSLHVLYSLLERFLEDEYCRGYMSSFIEHLKFMTSFAIHQTKAMVK